MDLEQYRKLVQGNGLPLPYPENVPLIRRCAADGIVLLENSGVLPLVPGKIALYGAGAGGTLFCGTGSGFVFTSHVTSVEEGLRNAGFTLTSEGWLERCRRHEETVNAEDTTLTQLDTTWSGITVLAEEPEITAKDLQAAPADTAVYVIRRNAGEGGDRKAVKGDYYLTDRETQNLTAVAAAYQHTVVVLNTCVIDMNFIHEIPGIDAVLYMGLGGMEAGSALADVLTGKVNPSGRLTDTIARRYEDFPTAGSFADQNGTELHPKYHDGVYVGYRYFDSFGVEPLYPFGYGLSYTEFSMETVSASAGWETVDVTVKVANTGKRPGRQVVQLYASAPAGKLDKPCQELKAYAKTKLLAPGESEKVVLSFPTEALASFDAERSAWVMEPGNYLLRVGEHSRKTAVAATVTLDGEAVVRKVTDCLALDEPLEELHAPAREAEAPQGVRLSLSASDCVTADNVSRMPKTVTTYVPEGSAYTSAVNANPYKTANFCEETVRTVRNVPNATLYDVKAGKVTMEEFVASLPNEVLVRICTGTLEESPYAVPDRTEKKLKPVSFPQSSGSTTGQYEQSLGIPAATLFDGPAGMHVVVLGACAFPVGMVVAQTWDDALQAQIGAAFAKEMAACHVTVALAPGMNIHRDPLGGRSFEYYSEDPVVSGRTAASFTKGLQADGKHGVAIKHFAANNQETKRAQAFNTVSPRALREIYLRGFELCVRQARPMTVMTSYNGINGVNTSSRRDLLTDILRGEWGFDGFVMTDWGSRSDKVLDFQAGNDIIMGGYSAEKLLDTMAAKPPKFTPDGSVVETVTTKYFGIVKTVLSDWGSFHPEAGGKDTVTTTVAAGTELNETVRKAVEAGAAAVRENADGSKTVTYRGTERGAYLARGTVQECAMRILKVIMNSAAMDDLLSR